MYNSRRGERPVAIVTGMIATYPLGGVAWDYGQYALGLERLGFEVFYLEDTGWLTFDPRVGEYSEDGEYGAEFLREALAKLSPSLAGRWHFRNLDDRIYGLSSADFAHIVQGAELFLNVSGGTLLRDEYIFCKRKILVDTDPGWNHFRNYPRSDAEPPWHGTHGYRAHDFFFTYAESLGTSGCLLPDLGITWQPTRPPVVLDCWRSEPPGTSWTTIMTWKNFKETIEYRGVRYGTKEMEFDRIETLPREIRAALEVAVGGGDAPSDRWRSLGWNVIDSVSISETAGSYRSYIERSRGEFSVAKNVYVATKSGWFSCRSACYLAAGRPVVVQDTGFTNHIPSGNGLLAFSDLEGAANAIDAVEQDYPRHQRAAREIAERYFDSDLVLGDILRRVGLA